jgi:hypothetical protein
MIETLLPYENSDRLGATASLHLAFAFIERLSQLTSLEFQDFSLLSVDGALLVELVSLHFELTGLHLEQLGLLTNKCLLVLRLPLIARTSSDCLPKALIANAAVTMAKIASSPVAIAVTQRAASIPEAYGLGPESSTGSRPLMGRFYRPPARTL